MSDETEYVRKVCEAGYGQGRNSRGAKAWYAADDLSEATWEEALAVIEAATKMRRAQKERGPHCVQEVCDVEDALEAYRAAVRAHRERSDG